MSKYLLFVLCVLLVASPCLAGVTGGVLTEERVVRLPNDEAKWHVSVVGETGSGEYSAVLAWFDEGKLADLKRQVHFHQVGTDSAIYESRYKPNVKGLPTVRVQKPDGTVVYEASGDSIPITPEGLYSAIAIEVNGAQGFRAILPWRRKMENRCCPRPPANPEPPNAEPVDPPAQPLGDGGPPEMEGGTAGWQVAFWAILSGLLGLMAGGVIGLVEAWKEKYFVQG